MEIDFEGATITAEDKTVSELDNLQPGDLYIARRNTGWKLLTCRAVFYTKCADRHGDLYPCDLSPPNSDKHPSFVAAVEPAYPFDAWEAYRVKGIQ